MKSPDGRGLRVVRPGQALIRNPVMRPRQTACHWVVNIPTNFTLGRHDDPIPFSIIPEVAFPRGLSVAFSKGPPTCWGVDAGHFARFAEAEFERHRDTPNGRGCQRSADDETRSMPTHQCRPASLRRTEESSSATVPSLGGPLLIGAPFGLALQWRKSSPPNHDDARG